jgi:hypothetical protein
MVMNNGGCDSGRGGEWVRRYLGWLFCMPLVMILLVGCAGMTHDEIKGSVQKPPPVVEEPTYIFHRVMAGETLGTIAGYYTGKESQWREIAVVNPELSPFNLKKDQIVKVPTAIATAHKEQPAYSTARKRAKKATKKATATSEPAQTEEPPAGDDDVPVFGPK